MRLDQQEGTRLVRVPLAGGPEHPIAIQGDMRPAGGVLNPSAVGKDGRILMWVAPPASWFMPAGILDPDTGRIQTIQIGYDADMPSPGWTPDGRIVVLAYPLRSTLWRFRPERVRK